MRIYVASSWRNTHQPEVVAKLRELGHEVYDFREPEDALEPCQVCIFAFIGSPSEPKSATEMLREADLMFKMADLITDSWDKVEGYLIGIERFN